MTTPDYFKKFLLFALSLYFSLSAHAGSVDLTQIAKQAQEKQTPIVIEFFLEYCEFCHKVENFYLYPLTSKTPPDIELVRINLHSTVDTLIDFQGTPVTSRAFADTFNASFGPTVVFVDYQGRRIAEDIVGYKGGDDYYGFFLDQALTTQRASLQLDVPTQ